MSKRKTGLVKALADVEARIVEMKTFQEFMSKAADIQEARGTATAVIAQLEQTRIFLSKYDTTAPVTDVPKVRKPRKPKEPAAAVAAAE
jgi:hypothetical protein